MNDSSTDPEITSVRRNNEHSPCGGGPLSVASFGLTDRGRVRANNEDQFLIAELRKAMWVRQASVPQSQTVYSDERGYLFLVADGMGGHRAGERASALALESIETFALNTLKWFFHLRGPEEQNVLAEFQAALRAADLRVFAEAAEHPELYGMGTTLTMAYVLGLDLYVAHVGDSRCYLLRGSELRPLTQDHTLVGELVQRGELAPAEAAGHRWRHVITNAVGGHEPGIRVEVHKLALEAGDVMLLCTDGLTEMVPDERIAAILQKEADPARACEHLVTEANQHGGKDNITVVVARFAEPSASTN